MTVRNKYKNLGCLESQINLLHDREMPRSPHLSTRPATSRSCSRESPTRTNMRLQFIRSILIRSRCHASLFASSLLFASIVWAFPWLNSLTRLIFRITGKMDKRGHRKGDRIPQYQTSFIETKHRVKMKRKKEAEEALEPETKPWQAAQCQ